jgi:acyl dehydratase
MPAHEKNPPRLLTFEDFPVGRVLDLGAKSVTETEVLAFAWTYDPQPFHLDRLAGEKSILGGLAASGWHTCAMLMRMIFDAFIKDTAGQGSPGLEQLRWKRPVLVGDTLSGHGKVTAARLSASRPGLGIVKIIYELANQRGETVIIWDCTHFILTRDKAREASKDCVEAAGA